MNTLLLLLIPLLAGLSATRPNSPADSPAAALSFQSNRDRGHKTNPPVLRGAPIGNSPFVPLSTVLKNPRAYQGRSIIVEGTIRNVCQNKGCWMEIAAGNRGKALRVTFKDYGFFVPTDSKRSRVRAEGTVRITTLSKEDVDHLTGEGATMKRNPDGTATEIGFVATGVEVRS